MYIQKYYVYLNLHVLVTSGPEWLFLAWTKTHVTGWLYPAIPDVFMIMYKIHNVSFQLKD